MAHLWCLLRNRWRDQGECEVRVVLRKYPSISSQRPTGSIVDVSSSSSIKLTTLAPRPLTTDLPETVPYCRCPFVLYRCLSRGHWRTSGRGSGDKHARSLPSRMSSGCRRLVAFGVTGSLTVDDMRAGERPDQLTCRMAPTSAETSPPALLLPLLSARHGETRWALPLTSKFNGIGSR